MIFLSEIYFRNAHHKPTDTTDAANKSKDESNPALGLAFPVGNLICAFMYYRFVYKSEGTVRPPWASMLG